jgi:23S rRNA pseudouridine1911/1915/1917 synthase
MTPDGFEILYEEGPCLAISKPGGLLTQAPPHIDSLEQRLRAYLQWRDAKPGRIYLGLPHRLDRPVSGVLLFARHVRAARRLSTQFERRMVTKHYVALLEGALDEQGEWVDHVRKIPDVARGEITDAAHPDARVARLRYRVLYRMTGYTCVDIELDTGRYHQIRVQAGARQHAVVGDVLYGARRAFGPVVSDERERCIALHARSLRFYHPMTHETRTVLAPWPAYWQDHAPATGEHDPAS